MRHGIKCSLLSLIWGILLLGSLSTTAQGENDGRYRAIVLHEGGSSNQAMTLSPRVFILDSRDGHMWTWEQNSRIHDAAGQLKFGTVLTYQGRLRPGTKSGEVVEQSHR